MPLSRAKVAAPIRDAACRLPMVPSSGIQQISAAAVFGPILGTMKDDPPKERFSAFNRPDKDLTATLWRDEILNFGGQSVEASWEALLDSNIEGMFNLYEAARKHSLPHIAFASSNHAIGYWRRNERIDSSAPVRPDGLYGVYKAFGEALASMYHDKFGIEIACIRIGSCFPEPTDHRVLSIWLSY